LIEPFTTMNFMPIGYAGGESVSNSLLAVSGNDAIVDWIHIELRTGAPSYTKVATMNALLQRDGDVVDVNGLPLYFPSVCPGGYHVKPGLANAPRKTDGAYRLLWSGDTRTNKNVKYNGAANDKDPILLALGNATPNNILYPVYRREDANMDGRVKYNNTDNDKNHILNEVLISNPSIQSPNAVISQHTPD
jgi:hypothetical protein